MRCTPEVTISFRSLGKYTPRLCKSMALLLDVLFQCTVSETLYVMVEMTFEQAEPRVRADMGYEQNSRKESETQKDFSEEAVGPAFLVVDVWHIVSQDLQQALAKQGWAGD